ncbi:MAG: zinc ribbon domain-containing protein [Patescibacteria group bacterium]
MENSQAMCPTCHQLIQEEYYFCPNCGQNLKEKPTAISIPAQIGWYIFAIILPPLGLWPGIKLMMKKSSQSKRVGIIIVILTLTSTILMSWAIISLFNSYLEQLNSAFYGL